MNHKKFLSNKNIFLREVNIEDVNERYYSWLNDPQIGEFLETRYHPHSKENITEFVKSMDGNSNEILLAICILNSDLHIGNIKLGPINWIHGFADVSLLIGDKEYWGKGIATQAIKLISKFAFEKLNLNKLKAGCYQENVGSKKAFLKAGFELEGILKSQWRLDNSFQDELILGLLREKYFKNE